ncbi:MAG: hypothetical protein MJZ18_05990 [Bacteroidales bacterium]|nr:hypothetical protein [Bacteroidales bacterium]
MMILKCLTIALALISVSNVLMAQDVSEEQKMKHEGLVKGTINLNGTDMPCYFHNIVNRPSIEFINNPMRFDRTDFLYDSDVKYLPKEVFDANDKIRNSMFVKVSVDEIKGYTYDDKYKLITVPNIAREAPLIGGLANKNVFMMELLNNDGWKILARNVSGRSDDQRITRLACNTFELYVFRNGMDYPEKLRDISPSRLFAMYPILMKKYDQGLYNVSRTAEQNKKLFGYNFVVPNFNSEVILNMIEDIVNGYADANETSKRTEWGTTECKAFGDSLLVNVMSEGMTHKFNILGTDVEKGKIRIASLTPLKPREINPYDFSSQVCARATELSEDCLLYSIHSFDANSGKYLYSLELLFDKNGNCLTNTNKNFNDLMDQYPQIFKKDMPKMIYDRSDWFFNPMVQAYFSDNMRSEVSLGGTKHPTRTDRYAKYHQEIVDYDALRTIAVYQDEPTKENSRQYLYGYEVIMTNENKETVSSSRIEWEFAKEYRNECVIRNIDGTPYGRMLFFYTANGKKFPTDPIEQRVNYVVVPYDGSQCYQGATDAMRKYDKGSERIQGAVKMNDDIYVLYTSYTRGTPSKDAKKETIEKVGFLKINKEGNTEDLSFAGEDMKEINTVIDNGSGKAQEKRKKDLNDNLPNYKFTWSRNLEIQKIHETKNKLYMITYSKHEKRLPLGTTAPLGYKPEMLYGEINVLVVDKNTKAIERVNTINEATTEDPRPIIITNVGDDDIQLTSSLITNDTIMNDIVITETNKKIRYRDGYNMLSTPHSVKIVNGVAQDAKLFKSNVMANHMTVTVPDGKTFLIVIGDTEKDLVFDFDKHTLQDIKHTKTISEIKKHVASNFIELVPIE